MARNDKPKPSFTVENFNEIVRSTNPGAVQRAGGTRPSTPFGQTVRAMTPAGAKAPKPAGTSASAGAPASRSTKPTKPKKARKARTRGY